LLKFKLGRYQIVTRRLAEFSAQKAAREAHQNEQRLALANPGGKIYRVLREEDMLTPEIIGRIFGIPVVFAGRRQWPLAQVVAPPFAIYSPSI